MALNKVLADTCVWIDFFSGRATPEADALEQSIINGTIVTCGVVMYELVQGVKSRQEEELIFRAFDGVPHFEMTRSLWAAAGKLSAVLRKQGITVPFSDILIAAIAMESGLDVLTIDRHFELIPGLRMIRPITDQ